MFENKKKGLPMGTVKKNNEDFYAKVDTNKDLFGAAAGFKASYVNDATGTVVDIAEAFTEVVKTVNGSTTTSNGGALAGAYILPVADASGFTDGDVIQDANGNMYYVESITGNDLAVKSKLVADIADSDTITQVGNTGIYRVLVNIATAGDYTIIVSNPSVNMQNIAFPVEIVDEDLDDAQDKLDDILNSLGISASERTYKGFV